MIRIPYGKGFIECDEGEWPVLTSRVSELRADASGAEMVRRAMANPVDSPRLCELARGKKNCVIIISDHTRPVPSRDIIPNMLSELRGASPGINITLLVATGFHRASTQQELEAKLGREIMEQCRVVVHDCENASSNVRIGVLPSGAPLVIDRLAAETELLVAEGFIEPHFFAGFSGGRKSVLPGICDRVTVMGNHCSAFIDSTFARTGILDGNPIHKDMLAAAEMAKLAYIVNVVIDEDKRTVAAFAGNSRTAHLRGCELTLDYFSVKAAPADIVVTSNGGEPLDQNLYQCVKGMTAAEACCNTGGEIIMCARCADGHGGEGFYRALRDCKSPAELYARQMATPQSETQPDQWESQILARILSRFRVTVVSEPENERLIRDMKMNYSSSLEQAIAQAKALGGQSLTFIPNGVSVIVRQ